MQISLIHLQKRYMYIINVWIVFKIVFPIVVDRKALLHSEAEFETTLISDQTNRRKYASINKHIGKIVSTGKWVTELIKCHGYEKGDPHQSQISRFLILAAHNWVRNLCPHFKNIYITDKCEALCKSINHWSLFILISLKLD